MQKRTILKKNLLAIINNKIKKTASAYAAEVAYLWGPVSGFYIISDIFARCKSGFRYFCIDNNDAEKSAKCWIFNRNFVQFADKYALEFARWMWYDGAKEVGTTT